MTMCIKKISSLLFVVTMVVGAFPGFFILGSADLVPNDDFTTAEVLAPGVPMSGTVNTTDDVDYYKFNVINAQMIQIKFEVTVAASSPWGQLFYPDHNSIVSTNNVAAGTFILVNFTTSSAKPGDYFFAVKGGDGSYTLTLTISNQNDASLGTDAGDTNTAATPITNGTFTGRVFDDDEWDYYRTMVVNAQIISLDLKTGTSTTDPLYARLYDPQKNTITSTDWINPGINVTWEFTTSFATAGWYYIGVTGGDNDYQLKVKVTPQNDSGKGIDASDSLTAPTMITPGPMFTGWISQDDDKDTYGFNIVNAQKISLTLKTGTVNSDQLYMKLYDTNKDSLKSTDWLNPDVSGTISYTTSSAKAGIYYVQVIGGDNSYSLRLTITDQNDANKGIDAMDAQPGLPVTVGKDYPGWIFDDDEEDYYSVNLTNGQTLTVNLTVGSATTNTQYLALYNSIKTKIRTTDYINSGASGSLVYTTSYETAGVYSVLVTGSDNDYKFSVAITNQSDANSGMDAPVAFEKAVGLKTGSYKGYMADDDEADMYNISVKMNHAFTVNFTTGTGGTGSMTLEIYDGSKSKIKTLTSAPDVKTTYTLEAADLPKVNTVYYLKVKDGEKQDYNLQVYLPELPPDSIAPVVLIATPVPNSAFSMANTTISGTATDSNSAVAKVQWALDNATFKDCTGTGAWVCAVTLPVGSNKVTVMATDPSGNKGYKDITLSYDNVVPTLTITGSPNGTKVSKAKYTISGTATDNVGLLRVEYQLNGGTWMLTTGTGTWSAELTLKTGKNTITIKVTDLAGNTVDKTITVEMKKTTKGFMPGFESALLIGAVMVGVIALSRKKR